MQEGLIALSKILGCEDTYYPKSYHHSREVFRAYAERIAHFNEKTQNEAFAIASAKDDDLTVDTCFIPAEKTPTHLIILSSGVHGIEGYVGAAMQFLFFEKILPQLNLEHTSVLCLHSINPFGFKYNRRVDENNVDLNRNFSIGRDLFFSPNGGYAKINAFLNPCRPLAISTLFGEYSDMGELFYYLKSYGKQVLRQAVLQGQYQFAQGIFYGGKSFCPQKEIVENLVKKHLKTHQMIFHADFHTGYGERGKLHFFGFPPTNPQQEGVMHHLFKGYKVDMGHEKDFYQIKGDFTQFIAMLTRPEHHYIAPMTFEYGTLDSQKIQGFIQSFYRVRHENQGFHHGYSDEKSAEKIKQQFRELFFPSSEKWRQQVVEQTDKVLQKLLPRFQSFRGVFES